MKDELTGGKESGQLTVVGLHRSTARRKRKRREVKCDNTTKIRRRRKKEKKKEHSNEWRIKNGTHSICCNVSQLLLLRLEVFFPKDLP